MEGENNLTGRRAGAARRARWIARQRAGHPPAARQRRGLSAACRSVRRSNRPRYRSLRSHSRTMWV